MLRDTIKSATLRAIIGDFIGLLSIMAALYVCLVLASAYDPSAIH